jgi:hypothetical protein
MLNFGLAALSGIQKMGLFINPLFTLETGKV